MGKIIAVSNHKGGVGKTTIVTNLSSYLLKYYKKILVMDFDPQANTTWALCEYAQDLKYRMEDVLRFGVANDLDNEEANNKFQLLFLNQND